MSKLLIIGKYLDQPRLVGKLSIAAPAVLVAGGSLYAVKHISQTSKEQKKKEFIKSFSVLTATIGSALIAAKGVGRIIVGNKTVFTGFEGLSEKIDLNEIAKVNADLVTNFLKNNKVSDEASRILKRAQNKVLKYSEVKKLFNELHGQKNGKEFLNRLIPDPENVDSKHIFSEIGRLSVVGLVPVLGGIAGGILGDRLTEKNWKDRIPDKIKEGAYQYLANIFMCNIGAGAALAILEKAKIKSKSARAFGMISGIILTGVVGGSAIANLIGKTCIDPLFKKDCGLSQLSNPNNKTKALYSERTPEALDIGLHMDDIATVAVLSGLKWIEPVLPILYSISGYRAGIGYRNGRENVKR